MIQKIFSATTTYAGADAPSTVFFKTEAAARAFIEKCDNGEVGVEIVESRDVLDMEETEAYTWAEIRFLGATHVASHRI